MFLACRSARDRLTLLLLSRVGLRPGQAAGLRRTDPHLMMDSRSLGCDIEGAHMHVVRRQNENGAWSKSRKSWVMPVDFLVVQAFDQYVLEHNELLGPAGSDFLLVNLFRPPFGTPRHNGCARGDVRVVVPAGRSRTADHPAHVPSRYGQQCRGCRRQAGRGPGPVGPEAS